MFSVAKLVKSFESVEEAIESRDDFRYSIAVSYFARFGSELDLVSVGVKNSE